MFPLGRPAMSRFDRVHSFLAMRPMRLLGWVGVAAALAGLALTWVVDVRLVGAVNRTVEPVEEAIVEIDVRMAERM